MAANRYSVVFVGAIVVAAAATYAVFRTMEESKASARIATLPVVVASQDIAEGQVIDRMSLSVAQWPAPTVPPGTFSSIDSVAGRVSRVSIFSGEPLVPGRLAPVGTGPGLEIKITPGKRAIGVAVNDVSTMSGMIQPNSRVDILLITNASNELTQTAKIFMSNMRVLAMGTEVQRGADGRPIQTTVATLELTPEETEKLAVAQTQGRIQLVLRGYGDPDSVNTSGASAADVAAALRDVAPPVARPQRAPGRPTSGIQRAAPQAAPVVNTAPPPPAVGPPRPVRPDSHSVRVLRGRVAEEKKFAKDSVRRDTTASNP
jgi:pilus assembly protein CpaB